jgi:glycosyltransferase involved in cell wall biosynthesis
VLFYGRMIPLHGVETIVRAAKLLEPDGIPFHLIGEGQVDIQRLLAERGPTNVRWTPGVPYESLPGLVAEAALCLGVFGTSAKAARVVPHKVYEAAAMGKPIATADTPAIREAFPDALALVPPGDPEALAEAIRGLCADPDRRARLGEAARARFEAAFSTRAIAAALARALDQARGLR